MLAATSHIVQVDTGGPTGWYQIATIIALLMTAVTGYFAYKAGERARKRERERDEQGELAKLRHAESAGWQTLVETLTKRYGESQKEVVSLAERLKTAHEGAVELQEQWRTLQLASQQRVAELEAELELAAHRHTAAMRELGIQIDHYRAEIVALKAEVADLRALQPGTTLRRRDDH